jgi:hypothetical protein
MDMVRKYSWVVFGLCCWGGAAQALDASGQRYVDQLVKGGPVSIRDAASSIYHTGMKDQEVLDVAAEVLAQSYQHPNGNSHLDALAWVCRALGASGNGRYKALLQQVADAGNRKLSKHCGGAADDLPAAAGPSYQPGSVDLAAYRNGTQPGASSAKAAAAPAAATAAGGGSFAQVKQGMSMEEVNALIGPATAMTSHITGKQFIPFNFRGKDTVRQVGLYKGKGRIIYSQDSAYTSVFRVMEIVNDPNESGYP